MALPANVGTGFVTGLFMDNSGGLLSGTITFTASPPKILDATSAPPTTILPGPVTVTLSAGTFLKELVATDDTDLNPFGFTYLVSFALKSGSTSVPVDSFSISVPTGTSSSPVDLTVASPVPVNTGTPYGPGMYDARLSGVVANGTTNDRDALVAAFTAGAAFGATTVLPTGTIHNGGAVIPLPTGCKVVGAGVDATTWDGPGLKMVGDNRVSHITFDGTNSPTDNAIQCSATVATTDSEVTRCKFRNYALPAVNLNASADGLGATRVSVTDCEFAAVDTAVLIERGYDCTIARNTSAPGSGNYSFAAYGAEGCKFLGNTVNGGLVGILLLTSVNVAVGMQIARNLVAGNRIVGTEAEGISLDVHGNAAASVGIIDWGTVASKAYNGGVPGGQLQVTLDSAFASSPASRFFGYSLVVTSGAAAGAVLSIDGDSGGGALACNGTRNSVYTNLTVGDEATICTPIVGNIIQGNSVTDAGTFSIVIWGMGVGNIIEANTCRSTLTSTNSETGGPAGEVAVIGLDGLGASTHAFTTRTGRARPLMNIVRDNALHRCDLRFKVITFGGASGFTLSTTNVRTENMLMNSDSTT